MPALLTAYGGVDVKLMNEDLLSIARYAAKQLQTEEIVAFADRNLTKGVYSDYLLAIIDEENKVWELVSALFESAVKDLGYDIPCFEEAIMGLIRHHLTLIAEEKVEPWEQFRILLFDIDEFDLHENITSYVGDSIGIESLYGWFHAIDDVDSESDLIKIKKGLISESKIWLEKHPCNKA